MQKNEQPNMQNPVEQAIPTASGIKEPGSVNVSGYVRVFDPNTEELLVEARE